MPGRPRVFISYAGPDEAAARRLHRDLEAAGVDAFFAPETVDPGANFVAAISRALESSDYCVLLLSRAALGRPWVEEEWTNALAREVNGRRAFLFVLRLDDAPLPGLLSARRYLDAGDGWSQAVESLLAVWKRDAGLEGPAKGVLPAPGLAAEAAPRPQDRLGIYVFNRDLEYQYFLRVPPQPSGRQLYALVKRELALPDRVDGPGGVMGLRFAYTLLHDGRPVAADREPLKALRGEDCLDLMVKPTYFGPDGEQVVGLYRGEPAAGEDRLDERTVRRLLRKALGHLVPEGEAWMGYG